MHACRPPARILKKKRTSSGFFQHTHCSRDLLFTTTPRPSASQPLDLRPPGQPLHSSAFLGLPRSYPTSQPGLREESA